MPTNKIDVSDLFNFKISFCLRKKLSLFVPFGTIQADSVSKIIEFERKISKPLLIHMLLLQQPATKMDMIYGFLQRHWHRCFELDNLYLSSKLEMWNKKCDQVPFPVNRWKALAANCKHFCVNWLGKMLLDQKQTFCEAFHNTFQVIIFVYLITIILGVKIMGKSIVKFQMEERN